MKTEDLETAKILVSWLKILSDGYVKPDVNNSKRCDEGDLDKCCNPTGVVRDTKDYREYAEHINQKLKQLTEI